MCLEKYSNVHNDIKLSHLDYYNLQGNHTNQPHNTEMKFKKTEKISERTIFTQGPLSNFFQRF